MPILYISSDFIFFTQHYSSEILPVFEYIATGHSFSLSGVYRMTILPHLLIHFYCQWTFQLFPVFCSCKQAGIHLLGLISRELPSAGLGAQLLIVRVCARLPSLVSPSTPFSKVVLLTGTPTSSTQVLVAPYLHQHLTLSDY